MIGPDESVQNLALYLAKDYHQQICAIVEQHLHLFGFQDADGDSRMVENLSHNMMVAFIIRLDIWQWRVLGLAAMGRGFCHHHQHLHQIGSVRWFRIIKNSWCGLLLLVFKIIMLSHRIWSVAIISSFRTYFQSFVYLGMQLYFQQKNHQNLFPSIIKSSEF